jgi:hypothetical protein
MFEDRAGILPVQARRLQDGFSQFKQDRHQWVVVIKRRMGKGQRAKGKGQRAKGKGQRAKGKVCANRGGDRHAIFCPSYKGFIFNCAFSLDIKKSVEDPS